MKFVAAHQTATSPTLQSIFQDVQGAIDIVVGSALSFNFGFIQRRSKPSARRANSPTLRAIPKLQTAVLRFALLCVCC